MRTITKTEPMEIIDEIKSALADKEKKIKFPGTLLYEVNPAVLLAIQAKTRDMMPEYNIREMNIVKTIDDNSSVIYVFSYYGEENGIG